MLGCLIGQHAPIYPRDGRDGRKIDEKKIRVFAERLRKIRRPTHSEITFTPTEDIECISSSK